ncbi:MAG: ankyrin repeat domain-containing protein [Gammaproteobacteria bacterium]|nr:ankyrin repeat domain-containing protein [Gammaproteobacteria bacterium]
MMRSNTPETLRDLTTLSREIIALIGASIPADEIVRLQKSNIIQEDHSIWRQKIKALPSRYSMFQQLEHEEKLTPQQEFYKIQRLANGLVEGVFWPIFNAVREGGVHAGLVELEEIVQTGSAPLLSLLSCQDHVDMTLPRLAKEMDNQALLDQIFKAIEEKSSQLVEGENDCNRLINNTSIACHQPADIIIQNMQNLKETQGAENFKKTLNEALWSAAENNNTEILEKLFIFFSQEINEIDHAEIFESIVVAALNNHINILKIFLDKSKSGLLEIGPDTLFTGKDGKNTSPLMYAAQYNHLEVIKFILKNIHSTEQDIKHALRVAARSGKIEIVNEILLPNPALQQYALTCATQGSKNALPVIETLLQKNPELIHAIDESGKTLLMHAVIAGNSLETVELLINHGAEISVEILEKAANIILSEDSGARATSILPFLCSIKPELEEEAIKKTPPQSRWLFKIQKPALRVEQEEKIPKSLTVK